VEKVVGHEVVCVAKSGAVLDGLITVFHQVRCAMAPHEAAKAHPKPDLSLAGPSFLEQALY
jgi:hypothetical protein